MVLREYLQALDEAAARVERLEKEILEHAQAMPQAPLVAALQSLRGVAAITAVTAVAEVGDLTRFPSAKQAMDYVGVVPSEHSSGGKQQRGSMTKSGNAHMRRVLVEAAWHYRHAPRVGAALRKRQQGQSARILAIAWKAQHRLNLKYRRLVGRGKPKQVAVITVARELVGFMWAIAHELAHQQRVQARAA